MKIGKAIMNFDELGIQGDKKELISLTLGCLIRTPYLRQSSTT